MIQKVDHLKKGDLIFVLGNYQNELGVYMYCTKDKEIVKTINYVPLFCSYITHIRTRNSNKQRVYKIDKENLSKEQLQAYNSILIDLDIVSPTFLILKDEVTKIGRLKLIELIGKGNKIEVLKYMNYSNDLGLKRNKEIVDELWGTPFALIKEIFKNSIL